jgi:flagellar hook-basal body complex protein FliE
MADPIQNVNLGTTLPVRPGGGIPAPAGKNNDAVSDFAATLRAQLERVSEMQTEADRGVQDLLTGQTQNISQVFSTARKAQVAFNLLMEVRNKLSDAYSEIRQMRV